MGVHSIAPYMPRHQPPHPRGQTPPTVAVNQSSGHCNLTRGRGGEGGSVGGWRFGTARHFHGAAVDPPGGSSHPGSASAAPDHRSHTRLWA